MSAYGKDESLLRNVGSFRQMSGQFSGGRANRSPRGAVPYFFDQYKPPTMTSDSIALIPGKFEHLIVDNSGDKPVTVPVSLPFVQFREHFDGATDRSAICSAGPFVNYKDLRNACNGCDIFWATLEPDGEGKKKSTRMSRQQKFAFSIIDFGKYHKQPQFDQNGRPKVNPKTNKQYFNWMKCEGLGCDGCKAKLETKVGHNPHWPMSWGYFQTLREADRQISKSCRSCGGIDTLRSLVWTCRGCGEAIVDIATTTMKAEDLAKFTEAFVTCACGRTDFLDEIIECSACPHGEQMTMFDVEFKVMRIPTQGNQSMLNISNWVRRRPLTGDLLELAKPKELLRIFAPTDNKKQLDKFGPPPLEQDLGQQAPPQEESRAYADPYQP